MWRQWLQFVGETCGARRQVILARFFGLRTGEAVAVKVEDVNLSADVPKLCVTGAVKGAKKSTGEVYVRQQHLAWMKKLMTHGISVERTKKHKHGQGRRKTVTFENTYKPPDQGWMFPSRRGSRVPYVCYHAVYLQVTWLLLPGWPGQRQTCQRLNVLQTETVRREEKQKRD